MRVELAHDVADDPGAFLEPRVRIEPQLAHREEEPPVDRLEPIAYVGQGPGGYGREGIGQISLAQRLGQRDLAGRGFEQVGLVGHGFPAGNRTMAS